MTIRTAESFRETKETRIEARLNLDGEGEADVCTGLGFLDHMLTNWAKHALVDLELKATGDLKVCDHHTVEDCALVLGGLLDEALGDRSGIARFGFAYAPLDEALARVVIDLSGRAYARVELGLRRERLGDVSTENLTHFLRSFAQAARMTLHVDLLEGENDHHRAEAAFKAFALSLRTSVARTGSIRVPSTKGVLV